MNSTSHFYDVGYQLKQKHWEKGYATESAQSALTYGFNQLNLKEIIGITAIENEASANILKKSAYNLSINLKKTKCNAIGLKSLPMNGDTLKVRIKKSSNFGVNH
jgi:RimJ/RimL family protein N-acetyltransferase